MIPNQEEEDHNVEAPQIERPFPIQGIHTITARSVRYQEQALTHDRIAEYLRLGVSKDRIQKATMGNLSEYDLAEIEKRMMALYGEAFIEMDQTGDMRIIDPDEVRIKGHNPAYIIFNECWMYDRHTWDCIKEVPTNNIPDWKVCLPHQRVQTSAAPSEATRAKLRAKRKKRK